MEKKIMKMLKDMRIPENYSGFYYWLELIMYVYKNYKVENLSSIKMEELYEMLAEKHDTTTIPIRRNMRTCIVNCGTYINKYFNKSKITSKKFLILSVLKLKERN